MPACVASPGQSMPCSAGRPGSRWPETTVKSAATPRCVSGMPASAGPGQRRADAGHDRHRHAGLGAGQPLLPAAAEDERVAALEPHDVRALPGAVDQHGVDLVLASGCGGGRTCRSRRPRRRRAACPAARAARAGRPPRRRRRPGPAGRCTVISPGSPGPPPTSVDPSGCVHAAVPAGRQVAGFQRRRDRVAQGAGPGGVVPAVHRDRHAVVPRDDGRPGRPLARGVGPDAEDASPHGARRDTAALTAGSSVHAIASHAPSRSAVDERARLDADAVHARQRRRTRPARRPARRAPAAASACARRVPPSRRRRRAPGGRSGRAAAGSRSRRPIRALRGRDRPRSVHLVWDHGSPWRRPQRC